MHADIALLDALLAHEPDDLECWLSAEEAYTLVHQALVKRNRRRRVNHTLEAEMLHTRLDLAYRQAGGYAGTQRGRQFYHGYSLWRAVRHLTRCLSSTRVLVIRCGLGRGPLAATRQRRGSLWDDEDCSPRGAWGGVLGVDVSGATPIAVRMRAVSRSPPLTRRIVRFFVGA